MKTKILFILHLPPPVHGASMVGKYIFDSSLINDSFECHYINLALAKDLTDIGKGGIKKLFTFISLLKTIWQKVKHCKPDLCYVTPNAKGGAFYKDFVVVQLLKLMGCRIVVHYHNKGVSTRQNKFLDNLLYKCFFKDLKVILLADTLRKDVQKYVSPDDIFICPNGIPVSKEIPLLEHEMFNVLFLSNMMEEKGAWTLLDACSVLKERHLNFHCHFVGKWSDISEEAFNNRVEQLGLSSYVTGHGAKYGEDKNRFFQEADVFVFPTYYHNECFPIVLLEAMEKGLPCISTNEGGIEGIIRDGKTGYVLQKKDVNGLADKLNYLLLHREECKKLGSLGKEYFLSHFTLDTFEKRLKSILVSCLNS